jgi:hypothetical protein
VVNLECPYPRLAEYAVDRLTGALVRRGVTVVERARLDLIQQEMIYQLSGAVGDDSMRSIGRQFGAASIVTGKGEDMGDHYLFRFRVLDVETAGIKGVISQPSAKDGRYLRLAEGEKAGLVIGKFTLGARLGAGIELNSFNAGLRPGYGKLETSSNVNFHGGVSGAYNLSPLLAVQLEAALAVNSGLTVSGYDNAMREAGGYTLEQCRVNEKFTYAALDIPLLIRLNFRPWNRALVSVLAGPHVSFVLGDIKDAAEYPNYTSENAAGNLKAASPLWGLSAGVKAGYNLGPGFLNLDLRFMNDFNALKAGTGAGKAELLTRRGLNLSLGYEFWL